jgi:hypothetical protein
MCNLKGYSLKVKEEGTESGIRHNPQGGPLYHPLMTVQFEATVELAEEYQCSG